MPIDENNYEVMSSITSDIQGFLLDMGADAGSFEYEHTIKGNKYYLAEVRFIGEDAADLATAIAEDIYELQEHLRAMYPDVTVTISLNTDDDEYLVEEQTIEELLEDIGVDLDSEDADETDNASKQYEEEGLHIICEDDEDIDFIETVDRDGDEDDDDFEDEVRASGTHRVNDDEGFYEEEDEDEYIPSDEDREELWKAFGGDEYE